MGGASGSWSWPVVPWTLEPEIGGRGDRRWLGFLEKSERVAGFFLERYTRGRVLARKCSSDKYRSAKDFPQILSVKFYINLLRPNLVD